MTIKEGLNQYKKLFKAIPTVEQLANHCNTDIAKVRMRMSRGDFELPKDKNITFREKFVLDNYGKMRTSEIAERMGYSIPQVNDVLDYQTRVGNYNRYRKRYKTQEARFREGVTSYDVGKKAKVTGGKYEGFLGFVTGEKGRLTEVTIKVNGEPIRLLLESFDWEVSEWNAQDVEKKRIIRCATGASW